MIIKIMKYSYLIAITISYVALYKRKVRHARERQMYKAYLKHTENVQAKYRMIPSRSILGFCVGQFRGIRLDGQYNGVN